MSAIKLIFSISRSISRVRYGPSTHKLSNMQFSNSSRKAFSEDFRKVQVHEDGDTLIVEGVVVNDTVSYAGDSTSQRACPICSRNLQVSYKDVLILDQFVSKKTGKILPRRVTGVCTKQHRQLEDCIDKAQKSGLLPPPDLSSVPLPPKDMRLPQGTFHTFYRSNTRGTKRKE